MLMLKKLDTSRHVEIFVYAGIFLFLVLCNILTPYVADDFSYSFSFATKKPLTGFRDIIPSMAAHARTINGRLTVHTMVQIFALLPNWVFDIVNSAMFCAQIAVLSAFCFDRQRSNLRTIAIFCAIWIWELCFGQVNLWQDGAVNYLWSGVVLFVYLYPFAERFLHETDFSEKTSAKVLFLLLSFLTGSFSETASAAAVLVAFLLLVLDRICNHRKFSAYGLISVAVTTAGYISMYLAPAQITNKSAGTSLIVLAKNFQIATSVYASFGVLIAVYVVLLVISVEEKLPVKRVLLSLSLIAGSLGANYILMFAKYYSQRSALATFVLLISAVVVLIPPVMECKIWKTLLTSGMILLALAAFPKVCDGAMDIYKINLRLGEQEAYIRNCVANGQMDIELPMIYADTKYCAIFYNAELSQDSDYWLNLIVAKYYGADTVVRAPDTP